MKTLAIIVIGIALVVASPALAEHVGPKAIAKGQSPKAAIDKIETACTARGFAVQRTSDVDVICQAGGLVTNKIEFRSAKPAQDPHDAPQEYHRFVARAERDDALVSERSTLVTLLMPTHNTKLTEVAPRLVAAKVINDRISELYAAIGFQLLK